MRRSARNRKTDPSTTTPAAYSCICRIAATSGVMFRST
jgi:hypothetical protein